MATRISSQIQNKQNIADILSDQSAAACVAPCKSQASKEDAKAAAKEKIQLSNSLIAEQLDAQARENHALLRPDMEPMERAKGQLPASTDSEANLTEQVDSCGSMEQIGFPMSSPVDGPMSPASQCPDIPMTENNEDDEDKRTIQNLEEELRKIKEKKKANKTAVCDAISAVRVEPPKSLVLNTTLGAKRPLTDATIQVGGLKPNWKEVINQARTSSHLTSNLKPANEDGLTNIDEFGVDESPQALQVQRAGKSHGTKHFQGLPEVKFEPVDVNMIAKEEIKTGKPAQPPKKCVTTKVSDIPSVNAGDPNAMNHKILPAMIQWVGS
ncbi:hypothetical protein EV359DRAFT_86879 [Lentinula novae-zelandiae]|nr:hypothetical protein EV359DRAFT_86879 [Lentinula novae-zelandiae]